MTPHSQLRPSSTPTSGDDAPEAMEADRGLGESRLSTPPVDGVPAVPVESTAVDSGPATGTRRMTPPMGKRRQQYVAGPGPWCGTPGGYANHCCRCDACREAWRLAVALRRAQRAATYDGSKCGKASTYLNYGCRCGACSLAHNGPRRPGVPS